jgi:predicted MFS family arabinose efflux permease
MSASDLDRAAIDGVIEGAVAPVLSPGTGRVILLLSMIAFGSAMSMRVMDAAIPRLAGDFGITIRHASNVVTVFAVAYGCLQIVFGPSGDRFGKLQVILFACASGALASLACALAPGFTALLIARIWAGASLASMMPLSMAWIGDNVSYENRQPVLAKFLVGQITGIAVGQAAGGIASDLVSWRAPFFFLAVWFVLMAALLFRMVRLPRHRDRTGNASALSLLAQCRSVLVRPWARRVLATVFVEGAALYGPFAFFATHLHLKHRLSLSLAGSMLVAFAVGGVSFAFGAGPLVGRLGEAGLARVGAMLMFVGISAVALGPASMPVAWFAIPGLFAMGLGFYMLHNTLQINATQMAPETRGTAVALFASSFFLGQSSGVALAGLAVERLSTTFVLLAGAIVLLVVGMVFGAMRLRRAK